MARQKKPVHRVQITEGKRNIIHQFLAESFSEDLILKQQEIPGQ